MNKVYGLAYLLFFTTLSYVSIGVGLFDSSYGDDNKISLLMKNLNTWAADWCKIHMVMITSTLVLLFHGWRKCQQRKITVLDFFFLLIFTGLAAMELVGLYLSYKNHLFDITFSNKVVIKRISRLNAFSDWTSLPLLGWIVAWSRYIRRGWYAKRNRVVFAASISLFFLTIIHPASFAFQLSVVGVLSCIALYEFYKVHFYRPGAKLMYWITLVSIMIFCLTRLLAHLSVIIDWRMFYINVLSLTSTTTTLSMLFLRIIEEINEHKK